MKKWPIYFSDNVYLSNPESETGILCLWTKKERIIEKIKPELYSFIGQLYSKDYGIIILIRNLLAKNDLRNLVMTGIDLNGSGEVVSALFNNGINKNGKIIGTETYLDKDIKYEHVELLRKRINFVDYTNIKKFEDLNELLSIEKKGGLGEEIILPLPQLEPPKRLPTDFSGFRARGLDFISAYKSLINFILKFGVFKDKKLRMWNITLISKEITNEDKQFLGKKKDLFVQPNDVSKDEYYDSYFFKELNAWDDLQEIVKNHDSKNSMNIMCFEAFIHEKDLESAYELIGSIPDSQRWDQDPHGSLLVRVENDLIIVTHLSPTGKVINEIKADNAKSLYKKINDEHKISLLYHALDIGGEIKKAEQALLKGKKYEQDKKK